MGYLWMPKMLVFARSELLVSLTKLTRFGLSLTVSICHSPHTSFNSLSTEDTGWFYTSYIIIICYTKNRPPALLTTPLYSSLYMCELLMLSPLYLGCMNSIVWFHSCGYHLHKDNVDFNSNTSHKLEHSLHYEIYKAFLVDKYQDNNSNHGYSTQLT